MSFTGAGVSVRSRRMFAQTRQGSPEVEQTLRLARDVIERSIARYRLATFASVAALTAGIHLMGLSTLWTPTAFFGVVSGYSALVWVYIDRRGNPPPLAFVALALDLGACLAPIFLAAGNDPQIGEMGERWFIAYIVGTAMLLTLLISSLRNEVAVASFGSLVAVSRYGATVPRVLGFHPGQLSVLLMLGLAGLVGVVSALQARKNLDNFARLELLRRYLPPEAVDRVMQGDPDSALAPGGRLVTVTLLSADLRGFTTMSESLAPTEIMAQLNAYHAAMIRVIDRYGGSIDKFIGDGTLVVFGLTGSAAAAAHAAVECSAAMLEALALHNQERAESGLPELAMGIAVHTGPVIAGNLGVRGRRLEFTVIGDAVNTVSRLEGHTKTAGSPVVISSETTEHLASTSHLRELAAVNLRGKVRPVRIFGFLRDCAPDSREREDVT